MNPQNPQPPYGQPYGQPQPPTPKKKGHGCLYTALGVAAAFVVLIVIVAVSAGGSGDPQPADSPAAATPGHSAKANHKAASKKVTIRVWGKAPGGVDIHYGTDSDNRSGSGDLPWSKTMTRAKGAMWYSVDAQLNGGGNIHCSVTVGGHTEKGHASGEYEICSAQVNAPLSGWN